MTITRRTLSLRLILVAVIALISIGAISLSARGQAASAAPTSIEPSAPMVLPSAPTVLPSAPTANVTRVITLTPTDDARAQGGSPPTQTFPSGFLYFSTLNGHLVFIQFDLLTLPVNATIDAAELRLEFTSVLTGPNGVNVSRANAPWDEETLTWPTAPTITWGNLTQTVSLNGPYSWNVTGLVNKWHTGTSPNYGFGMRGDGGPLVAAHSKETAVPPKLIITYTVPASAGAQPDLGDAPDSTNHVGISNTAYPGVDGRFPTVWAGTPITQPAGPRHANLTLEGWLGDWLSREGEADGGPDEDVVNNILNGGADNANNDRGDEGWLNRRATFNDCEQTTLKVRVSKSPTATLNKMYLNVWFDGSHDGDWNDEAPCLPQGEELRIPSTEWIVQDYIVDMTGIAPGGFADININTETVLNTSPHAAHWLRFTLSEVRAPQSGGRADGRGPNPNTEYSSYHFGETEDYWQKPHPVGAPGTLQLIKSVTVKTTPTYWIDYVTYTVRLKHNGGTEPIEARLRDELPYPLIVYPMIDASGIKYVDVTNPTGDASPLAAGLDVIPPSGSTPPQQVVKWAGTLAPDSEVKLVFKVRVIALCQSGQQTMQFTNTAQARPVGGSFITDTATFTSACIDYTGPYIESHWVDPITPTLNITDVWHWVNYNGGNQTEAVSTEAKQGGTEAKTEAIVTNRHPVTAGLLITRILTTTLPGHTVINLPHFDKVMLPPSQTLTLTYGLTFGDLVTDELQLTDDFTAVQRLGFCILPDPDANHCPDPKKFPDLFGQGAPLTITVRPHDLGDAPDSTNHAGVAMTAYPAVQASYPTVYDPALGLPIGPMHRHPRPFHLGQNVSREVGADVGPDEDPLNNIEPAANDPDNDRFDDGLNPNAWSLANCQTRVIPVRVFISPQAVNWFQQQNKPAYINIWLDGNRDGDWADGFNCPPDQAGVEHIVIDRAVNVVALGAGLHTLNVATGLIPWPAALAQQPSWVRVTLSDFPSNKPLTLGGINYGDGRGYAIPFHTGETEDYLAYPDGVVGGGPDLAVRLAGDVQRGTAQQSAILAPTAITSTDQIKFKIEYGNFGSRPASGGLLTFTIPTQLQGITPTVLHAPGIPLGDIQRTNNRISFLLPYLEQDNVHQIVIGWERPVNGFTPYTATARIDVAGDLDPSNNQATTMITPTQPSPIIAILIGLLTQPWSGADTTSRTTVDFAGMGTPGQTVEVLLDDAPAGTALIEPEGIFYFQLSNLAPGRHRVGARYSSATHIKSPRDVASGQATGLINVDPTLPFDPLSLTFTDSHGRITHPRTLGLADGTSNTLMFSELTSGETYELGVNSTVNVPNQNFKVTFEDILISSLRDDDGDGRYIGSFVYNPIVVHSPMVATAANELRLSIINGGVEQSYGLMVQPLVSGVVRDALTQQPLANASLALLGAQLQAGVASIFEAWSSVALGQPNPQTTGVDGAYAFNTPGNLNRVDVVRSGYQSYRSFDLAASNGVIAQDIDLTPQITATATYTVFITENGFEPAVLKVAPGSSIEWVNVDLAEHTTKNTTWDSGVLSAGQSYRFKVNATGTYAYADDANPENTAIVIVDGYRLYLPLIVR